MLAGLFGKRRYRIERRDKILLKRNLRRFFFKRSVISRSVLTFVKFTRTRR